jgi:hypothetical protein
MAQLVEFSKVTKQSKDVKLLHELYQIKMMRVEAEDLIYRLARRDRIAIPFMDSDEDAFYRFETETIFLPARTRAQIAVHEYAHHRTWVKIQRRSPESELPSHSPEFVRCLDLSAKWAWWYLTGAHWKGRVASPD